MNKSKTTLTIATYNIELSIQVEKIIDNITAMAKKGVDVFCLQEVVNSPNQEVIITTLLNRLGKNWKAANHLEDPTLETNIGTCILWNTKILQYQEEKKVSFPKLKRLGLHEKFFAKLIGGSTSSLQRRAITCTFLFSKKTMQITSLHLDHVGGTNHRIKQMEYFFAKKPMSPYEIICGDFNTFDLLQTGKEKALLHKTFGPEYIDASATVGPTADIYEMNMQRVLLLFKWVVKTLHIHIKRRLDYIWVKNFQIVDCYTGDVSGSDHLPIIAKLKIR